MKPATLSPLVAVAGPTGSGKSDLAMDIAAEFGGEIVNCDSLQIYRHFDIGTAKIRAEDRRGIPHHLLDIAGPDELFTAGEYARLARLLLREISERGRLPVVVGGTGFYLRALLEGLFPGPGRDEPLRARLAAAEARRGGVLHRFLTRCDRASAARIHPHDTQKLIRALEVCLLERRPLSEVFDRGRDTLPGFRSLKIALNPPRELLFARLDRRTRAMFESGLVEETRSILAQGFAPSLKPFASHGYRQALQMLRGELKPEEAVYYAQRDTRRYAKRQWTWLRQEKGLEWYDGFGDQAATRRVVLDRVRGFVAVLSEDSWETAEQNSGSSVLVPGNTAYRNLKTIQGDLRKP